MSNTDYASIDYSELKEELLSDMAEGILNNDSEIFIVRQNDKVKIGSRDYYPIMDYFYSSPKLCTKLCPMKVIDVKKLLFDDLGRFEDEFSKETIKILIDDIKEYTKARPKRNDKTCHVLFTEGTELPLMLFYEEESPVTEVFTSKVSDILDEIGECFPEKE